MFWNWCWCHALGIFLTEPDKVLILVKSRYIWGVVHAMVADREVLRFIEIEESIPLGEKRHGWRGVWHALTSHWYVRKGKGEE